MNLEVKGLARTSVRSITKDAQAHPEPGQIYSEHAVGLPTERSHGYLWYSESQAVPISQVGRPIACGEPWSC